MKSPKEAAYEIAYWLANQLTLDGFPARTFYGESFCLWLWSQFPDEFSSEITQIRPIALQKLNRNDIDGHPEFNLFALLEYCQTANLPITELPSLDPKFRNTANSNWLLLGNLGRVLWNNLNQKEIYSQKVLYWHTKLLLRMQQQSDGLIRDDRLYSRQLPIPLLYGKGGQLGIQYLPRLSNLSLQYHCFSLALLQKLYTETDWPLTQHIKYGIDAILQFTLPNGDTNYLGRGQQQIFGYAALLFVLSEFCKDTNNSTYATKWHKIWRFFLSYQREDLSWPLVLRQDEKGFPEKVNISDPRWLGWYGYNNYFDYLPLLGAFLAQCDLPDIPSNLEQVHNTQSLITDRHAVIEQKIWKGTITKPEGALSHDQPIPYLCVNGRSILPCYGGDESQGGLYNLSMLPLPFFKLKDEKFIYLRSILKWKLKSKSPTQVLLKGKGKWATFTRLYEWTDNYIHFQDHLTIHPNHRTSPKNLLQVIPFQFCCFQLHQLKSNHYEIFRNPIVTLHIKDLEKEPQLLEGYSPTSKLKIIREQLDWSKQFRTHTQIEFTRNFSLSWTNQ